LRKLPVALLLLAAVTFGQVEGAFGFSFGGIEVRSGFGDRFDADIELIVEGDDVEVALGDEADYQRLELDRRDLIDRLKIVFPLEEREGKKIIHVVSDQPLFFPSFYLVVRATHYGGTLLKRYLITVDFRQSLALNVQGAGKETPAADEPVDLLEEARPSGGEQAEGGQAKTARSRADQGGEFVSGQASQARPPASQVAAPVMRRHHAGAIWVAQRAPVKVWFPPEESREVAKADPAVDTPSAIPPTAEPDTPTDVKPSATPGEKAPEANERESAEEPPAATSPSEGEPRETVLLEEGESLFDVAKRIAPVDVDAARVTVALWMDNQGKFINGNMNWVREGTRLNVDNLERRLADLDLETAQKALWSQWQEWKLIRKTRLSPVAAEANEAVEEKPLPGEGVAGKEAMFALARTWAGTWEASDLAGHLALFAAASPEGESPEARLRSRKARLFKDHTQVRLETLPAALVFRSGRPWLSFDQVFYSEQIESFGRKDLRLVLEGENWKIADEKLELKQYKELGQAPQAEEAANKPAARRYLDAPYVVHASTHPDSIAATRAVNRLREKGYDAYSVPVSLPGGGVLYRVHLGRFADWELGLELAGEVRSLDGGRDAIVMNLPYTLEAGIFSSEGQAAELVASLRRQGFSALLYAKSESGFGKPIFQVFIGAFADAEAAGETAERLKARDIHFTLVTP